MPRGKSLTWSLSLVSFFFSFPCLVLALFFFPFLFFFLLFGGDGFHSLTQDLVFPNARFLALEGRIDMKEWKKDLSNEAGAVREGGRKCLIWWFDHWKGSIGKGTIVIRALLILVHREGWRMPGYLSFEYITPQKLQNKQGGEKEGKKASI